MIHIALIGDIAFSGIINTQHDKNYERFNLISSILNNYNIVFSNFEVPIINYDYEKNELKNYFLSTNSEVSISLLKQFNIKCVSIANNHIYDYKLNGLKSTIKLLDENKIKHTGAGWIKNQCEPVIINENNFKIGFLAYVDKNTNPKTEAFPELFINYFDMEKVKCDLLKIKNEVNLIICSIHWGKDYSSYYSKQQKKIAHELIDSGIDIIMGHHPHTIQPYEVYKNKLIFYSLGGLCFGDFFINGELRALKRKTKLGMIAVVNDKGGMEDIIPTKELKGNYIIIPEINIKHKLKRLSFYNRLKNKYYIFNLLIKLKETVIDRIYEYFFGYYRNPLKQLVSFSNLKKINFIFRDIKEK